jgi:mono/diheme cytochrome c family protein
MRPSASVQFPRTSPRVPRSRFARPRARLAPLAPLACLVAWLVCATGCDRPPSADSLKEWTQADHHSSDDDKAAAQQGMMQGQVPRGTAPKGGDVAQLVDITWRQQCTSCHGSMGRGDGQMGPMVQAPDLTRADWQSQITDADMAGIIKGGRNRMPRFDLPDPVIAGLVARIRALAAH